MPSLSPILCFAGLALFLLGLLNGFAIPRLKSPRLGLSAHLTAVQSGTFLLAVGLVWPRLGLTGLIGALVGHVLWLSLFGLWLALLLAGVFGAGEGFAIAGEGKTTTRAPQTLVTGLLAVSALACTAAVIGVLIGWRWWS